MSESAQSCCHGHSDAGRPKRPASESGAAYICPMCEGVESDTPGSCPKCGMALEPAQPQAATKVQYSCPMHPEIIRDEPGECPICGMALEAITVTREREPNP